MEIKISTSQADFFCAQLWLQVNIPRVKSACQIPNGAGRRFLNLQLIVLPNLSVGNDLYFWASPMVRQEAMLGSPCRKSQLLDDLISWHRYGLNFFYYQKLERSCSVHSTGQKNPCIRKFIPGVKFQLSPNSMSNSMSFNNESTMFWKITPLKGSKTLHLLVVKQKVYHLFFFLFSFFFFRPANRLNCNESRYDGKCQDKKVSLVDK